MPFHESLCNLHMHTPYSDGEWYHADIAAAAARAGLDMIAVTDHNVWVNGPSRYYKFDDRRVLVLVGEEIHDQTRQPQKNHLLAYGAECELARLAPEPQKLIDAVREAGGLTFLAHPHDGAVPLIGYEGIAWVNWEVSGFTGLEIWNYMSDWARLLTSKSTAIRYALEPELGLAGPSPETLAKWDELTSAGLRIVGIGSSDAHANEISQWGLTRVIFPYEFLFRQLNTHILTQQPLSGDYAADRALLLAALGEGNCFIGYDGAGPTRGFRFTANSDRGEASMGGLIGNQGGLTFQITPPGPCQIRLLRDGRPIGQWDTQAAVTQILPPRESGVFRVECHTLFKGRPRGWIYSNPIYVTGKR